jgi:hypothetical protein
VVRSAYVVIRRLALLVAAVWVGRWAAGVLAGYAGRRWYSPKRVMEEGRAERR